MQPPTPTGCSLGTVASMAATFRNSGSSNQSLDSPLELCDALSVSPGELVAIVGGGGKTAALYRLGAELPARGVPVLLSGTTRFTPPERGEAPNLAIVEDEGALRRALDAGRWPLTVASGWGSKG